MASSKSGKSRQPHKCVITNQESPAIELHLLQLGAHHSVEVQDEFSQAGVAAECLLSTHFATEE